jgi:hypothetical protein
VCKDFAIKKPLPKEQLLICSLILTLELIRLQKHVSDFAGFSDWLGDKF